MAYIDLGVDEEEFPGITGPMRFRPETAQPLNMLAEVLLRAPHSISPGERELIAAYVSGLNNCTFCRSSHSAFAAVQLDAGMSLVDKVRADLDSRRRGRKTTCRRPRASSSTATAPERTIVAELPSDLCRARPPARCSARHRC